MKTFVFPVILEASGDLNIRATSMEEAKKKFGQWKKQMDNPCEVFESGVAPVFGGCYSVSDDPYDNPLEVEDMETLEAYYVSCEPGFEGEYTESEMAGIYGKRVDKSEYPTYEVWKADMLKNGVYAEKYG